MRLTRRLLGQSKNYAKKAVEEVVKLREGLQELENECARLSDALVDFRSDTVDRLEMKETLEKAREKAKKSRGLLRKKEGELGVREQQRVKHLVESPFLWARMNALALKNRLMQRLRARKFEHDQIERSFRKAQAGTL